MKVFICGDIPEVAIDLLKQNNYSVEKWNKKEPIPKSKLINKAKEADGIISLLTDKFDNEVIDRLKNCKVIANYAAGYNNINIDYASQKGIAVTNTPDVLTDATADIAIGLMLAASRRFYEGEKLVRTGDFKGWHPKLLLGPSLMNKNFGVLGAGRIGTAAAIRAKAFGMNIIYYSRTKHQEIEDKTGAKKVTLINLLKKSDFLSLHIPLNDSTRNILDKDKLELLKETAIVINTARGEVIDEKYLITMLKKKRIFAAGFDVYENEPDINKNLLKLDNVILLPHLGSGNIETRNKMAEITAKDVIAVLKGKKPLYKVN